jgi:cytochrome P450
MAGPIERIESASDDPVWHVTRHAEVRVLLSDERLGMPHALSAKALAGPRGTGMSRQAAARGRYEYTTHTNWRKTMNKVFSTATFDSAGPHIRQTAECLVDELAARTPPVELHESYTVPFSARVVCALLDVPAEDIPRFRAWTGDDHWPDTSRPEGGRDKLVGYARELVARRREQPGEDALSRLLLAGTLSPRVHDARVAELVAGALSFGWQTTGAFIDYGIILLLSHPDQRDLLLAKPELIPSAANEVLRLSRPPMLSGGGIHRQAHEDVDVGGITIRTGDKVLLDLSEANRDADVFPDPDRFDITRDPNPHLSFGYAFYLCNFARLSRSEIEIGLGTLFGRLPGLKLAAGADLPERPWLDQPRRVDVTW